jgi:hypothetical protein
LPFRSFFRATFWPMSDPFGAAKRLYADFPEVAA